MAYTIYRIKIEGWVTDQQDIGLPDNWSIEKLVGAMDDSAMNVTVTKVDELGDEESKSGDV